MEELLNNVNFSTMAWQIATPFIFIAIDVISGYVQALINKCVESKKMREGLLHKFLLTLVILLGYVIQFAFNLGFVAQSITIYICVMELMSILENLKKAGVDLKGLGNILKDKNEEDKQNEK